MDTTPFWMNRGFPVMPQLLPPPFSPSSKKPERTQTQGLQFRVHDMGGGGGVGRRTRRLCQMRIFKANAVPKFYQPSDSSNEAMRQAAFEQSVGLSGLCLLRCRPPANLLSLVLAEPPTNIFPPPFDRAKPTGISLSPHQSYPVLIVTD